MRRRHLTSTLLTGLLLVGLTGTAAVAQQRPGDPAPDDPAYALREFDNASRALGRQTDQLTNPDFHLALGPATVDTMGANLARQLRQPLSPIVTLSQLVPGGRAADPFRIDWAEQGRGVRTDISYPNRYGATIRGSLWAPKLPFTDPVSGRRTDGPLPTIVITTGSIQGFQEMYLWAAQGLAEAGYLVMTYDVQGQGTSDTFPGGGVLGCDVIGLAGGDGDACPGVPFQQRGNFVEGTEDALAWLVSRRNPLRSLVDTERIGLAGHSLGASAVTEVGNRRQPVPGRPDIRIRAVVGWDDANLPADLAPRVPTMGQAAEGFFTPAVDLQPPDPDAHLGTHERFVAAGVPSYHSTYRSSTHLEWTYIPLILPASSAGERVAMHQTLAWFDRYVKGVKRAGLPEAGQKAIRQHAVRRLTAARFDDSADRSAIGAGRYEPGVGNVPYRIRGEAVADHLSYKYRSAYAFHGRTCVDIRAGC